MPRSFCLKLEISLLSALVGAGLSACGGGGGGGGGFVTKAPITPQVAKDYISKVENRVANCQSAVVPPVSPKSAGIYRAAERGDVRQLAQLVDMAQSLSTSANTEGRAALMAAGSDNGTCLAHPGTVTVTSTHVHGVTDYKVSFNSYCVSGPDGESVYEGELLAKQVGTPTDSGPMISEMKVSTASGKPITVHTDAAAVDGGPSMEISIGGVRTVYGVPATWSPGTPTDANPDKTTATDIVVKDLTNNETHKLNNVSLTRSGIQTDATIEISSGTYVNENNESVSVSTPLTEPSRVNLTTGEWLAGVVKVVGKDAAVAEIAPVGGRKIEIKVDGTTVDTSLDCNNSAAPAGALLDQMFTKLPLY